MGLWFSQAREREWYRIRDDPAVAEASVMVHQPEVCVCSPGEVVSGSWYPGSGRLHRLLGQEVWRVACACTQASWWLQQQL